MNPKTLNGFVHLDTTKCTVQDDIIFAGIHLLVSLELFVLITKTAKIVCFTNINQKIVSNKIKLLSSMHYSVLARYHQVLRHNNHKW